MSDAEDIPQAQRRWSRYIPNAALNPDLLPHPDAPWSELVYFAGTFNGYQLQHGIENAAPVLAEAERHFRATGELTGVGLSALRALLFFEQRADHFGGGYGFEGESLRFVHVLVEGIREHVTQRALSPDASDPATLTVGAIQDRVIDAFERLVFEYARWGGYRSHGWTRYEDPQNYFGPVIRSESDCALRFAWELEREWPLAVHAEFPVSKANFADFDKNTESQQRVDLAVTELGRFLEDETSQERFRSHRHEAFIEVKWLVKGWRGNPFEMDARKRVASVGVDAVKLANHLRLGRCAVAAAFVVDDEDYFAGESEMLEWPADVWRLVLGPETLRGYGLLPDQGRSAPGRA